MGESLGHLALHKEARRCCPEGPPPREFVSLRWQEQSQPPYSPQVRSWRLKEALFASPQILSKVFSETATIRKGARSSFSGQKFPVNSLGSSCPPLPVSSGSPFDGHHLLGKPCQEWSRAKPPSLLEFRNRFLSKHTFPLQTRTMSSLGDFSSRLGVPSFVPTKRVT